MKYTVRYAHLEKLSPLIIGQRVKEGDFIGIMGTTGQSTGEHLHIDNRKGFYSYAYRMADIDLEQETIRQLNYFIDKDLFRHPIVITSYYMDPEYIINGKWKIHPAYDVVPKNRKKTKENYGIYWNRSKEGTVLLNGYSEGYGNYVHIGYET